MRRRQRAVENIVRIMRGRAVEEVVIHRDPLGDVMMYEEAKKCGGLEGVLELVQRVEHGEGKGLFRGPRTNSYLVEKLHDKGRHDKAVTIVKEMIERGEAPTSATLGKLLYTYACDRELYFTLTTVLVNSSYDEELSVFPAQALARGLALYKNDPHAALAALGDFTPFRYTLQDIASLLTIEETAKILQLRFKIWKWDRSTALYRCALLWSCRDVHVAYDVYRFERKRKGGCDMEVVAVMCETLIRFGECQGVIEVYKDAKKLNLRLVQLVFAACRKGCVEGGDAEMFVRYAFTLMEGLDALAIPLTKTGGLDLLEICKHQKTAQKIDSIRQKLRDSKVQETQDLAQAYEAAYAACSVDKKITPLTQWNNAKGLLPSMTNSKKFKPSF